MLDKSDNKTRRIGRIRRNQVVEIFDKSPADLLKTNPVMPDELVLIGDDINLYEVEINGVWHPESQVQPDRDDWILLDVADVLAEAKATALNTVILFADSITAPLLAKYPQAETAAWPAKQAEARALLAGGKLADTVVLKALADESNLDAAGVQILAKTILIKAAQFAAISVAIEVLRNAAETTIAAVTKIEDLPAVMAELKQTAEAKAKTLGLM